jgi:hypothetical protein
VSVVSTVCIQYINAAHGGRVHDLIPRRAGNANVDENALMAAQIQEIERFECERRAFEALRVPRPIPRAVPPRENHPIVHKLSARQAGGAGGNVQEPFALYSSGLSGHIVG